MNELLLTLLSLSLSGTLLALFILLLKKSYINRFSRCWQYYIWLAAVLRFLVPFAPDHTIVSTLFQMAAEAQSGKASLAHTDLANLQASESQIDAAQPQAPMSQNGAAQPLPAGRQAGTPSPSERNSGTEAKHSALDHKNVSVCFMVLWLLPALIILIRKIMSYHGFMRYIKTAGAEVSDLRILNLLAACEEKYKVRKTVELYHRPQLASPVMTGFFRPCIVIPDDQMPEKDLTFIFMHELIHYKRRDMFYKWLLQAVICIHWFNPFVYLLEKEVSHACELSCDEAVIHALSREQKIAYGNTLLLCSKTAITSRSPVSSLTLSEGAEQLKERLGAIMNDKKRTKKTKTMTAILTVCICLGSVWIGAYAAPKHSAQAKEELHVQSVPSGEAAANKKGSFASESGIPYEIPAAVKKVLTLKTRDYKDHTLAEFSDYVSQRYETDNSLWKARQRLMAYMNEETKKNLSKEDYEFLHITLPCTESESTYPHDRAGSIPPGFGCQFQVPYPKHKTMRLFEWHVQYQVNNPDMTIRERDRLILNVENGMQEFVEKTLPDATPEAKSYLKKMRKRLNQLAKENSTSGLEMTVFKCSGG